MHWVFGCTGGTQAAGDSLLQHNEGNSCVIMSPMHHRSDYIHTFCFVYVLSSTRQHVGEALLALKRVHHEIYTTPCGATVYSFSHNMYHNSNTSVFVIATVAQ